MEPGTRRLLKEGRELLEEGLIRELGQRWASAFFRRLHYYLNGGAALAATVAGFAGLSDLAGDYTTALTSLFALTAAVLSVLATFLKPEREAQRRIALANQYDRFNGDLRRFLMFKCREADESEELLLKLDEFAERKSELKESGPPIPKKTYMSAKTRIIEESPPGYLIEIRALTDETGEERHP